MTDSSLEKEWAELREWEYQESEKLDKKYPYEGGFDGASEEHKKLKKEFYKRVEELKKKYNIN